MVPYREVCNPIGQYGMGGMKVPDFGLATPVAER
jgi:hypothetical protein